MQTGKKSRLEHGPRYLGDSSGGEPLPGPWTAGSRRRTPCSGVRRGSHNEDGEDADRSLQGVLRPLVATERSYPIRVPHRVFAVRHAGSLHTEESPVPQRFQGEAVLRALQECGD